jgi:ABC-2 type transport system permease protein
MPEDVHDALLVMEQDTVLFLAAAQLTAVVLPLTLLSSALMQQNLMPDWIRTVSKFNPVNWAVEAGRSAAMQNVDWSLVAGRFALLAALVLISAALATRAFGVDQRSL